MEHGVSPTGAQRKSIKKDIMYVLFQNNRKHRELVGRSSVIREVLSFRKSIYSQDYGQSREEEFLLITAAGGELPNIGLCGSRIP